LDARARSPPRTAAHSRAALSAMATAGYTNLCCFACVDQSALGFVTRFGRFVRFAEPGCTVVNCPCGEQVGGALSLRVQQLNVQCETKTKDNVFVITRIAVQYEVLREDAYNAYYKLTDPRGQITSYVFDVVRSYIPRIDLDDVFTTKEDIAQAVKDELGKAMSSYGYQILQTLVTDIEPASNVKAAMNDINAAHRQRVAALERAEAEKLQVVKAAEADAEAKHLAGQGIARQRQAIVNGLRESVNTFQEDVTEVNAREVLNLVLTTQYFDTLNSIGSSSRTNTVFVPHGPGAVSDVAQQIAAGGIMAAATTQTMKRGR
jgi:regulator of protease activity HflC (stomatin/prohibitin superfamily)